MQYDTIQTGGRFGPPAGGLQAGLGADGGPRGMKNVVFQFQYNFRTFKIYLKLPEHSH